jgi:predicted ATPase
MKIKSVELRDHPGVGDMYVSFADGEGNAFNTVILAGANGTGKTVLLNAVQNIFEANLGGNSGIVSVEMLLDENDLAIVAKAGPNFPSFEHCSSIKLIKDTNNTSNWDAYQFEWAAADGQIYRQAAPAHVEVWRKHFRSFYNEARVEYRAGNPQSVTALSLDNPDILALRSGNNSEIAQLLVDIRASDSEDLASWVRANPGIAPPENIQSLRFSRFETALNYMFPTKRFKRVQRDVGSLGLIFEEHGRESSLDNLSTGEKQILFRAGFFLRNLRAVSSGIVLLDEPELSLHPEWQERILGFYSAILTGMDGKHPQIIASTHSPFIVHGAANAKIVILEKDLQTGQIRQMADPVYPALNSPASVRAFNIDAFLEKSRKPLLVLTEGETDVTILETAWRKLFPHEPMRFELRAALGDKNLNITLNDSELFAKLGERAIVGIFDFDSAFNQWKGALKKGVELTISERDGLLKKHAEHRIWAMLLPVPEFRSKLASRELGKNSAMSIEFMFHEEYFPPNFVEYEKHALDQKTPYIPTGRKADFAKKVADFERVAFESFRPLFARLTEILDGGT